MSWAGCKRASGPARRCPCGRSCWSPSWYSCGWLSGCRFAATNEPTVHKVTRDRAASEAATAAVVGARASHALTWVPCCKHGGLCCTPVEARPVTSAFRCLPRNSVRVELDVSLAGGAVAGLAVEDPHRIDGWCNRSAHLAHGGRCLGVDLYMRCTQEQPSSDQPERTRRRARSRETGRQATRPLATPIPPGLQNHVRLHCTHCTARVT